MDGLLNGLVLVTLVGLCSLAIFVGYWLDQLHARVAELEERVEEVEER